MSEDEKASNAQISFLQLYLIFLALYSLAFLQPLLSALGDSATFFVAHKAAKAEVLTFTLLATLLVPIIVGIIGLGLRLFDKKINAIFLSVIILVLGFLFGLTLFKGAFGFSPYLTVAIALLFSVILLFGIKKIELLRTILIFSSVSIVIVNIYFLKFTQVSEIITDGKVNQKIQLPIDHPKPVVFIVFDEFNPVGLLDENMNIDRVRFPNFHKLAEKSTWYPNASSVHVQSFKAVPAILTGLTPPDGDPLPSTRSYPDNIFTLLGDSYEFNVLETFTALCPEQYCATENDEDEIQKFNLSEFTSDLKIIVKHIFYPRIWAEKFLPPLNAGWKNFKILPDATEISETNEKTTDTELSGKEKLAAQRKKNFRENDLYNAFENFIEKIGNENNSLNLIHTVLPHTPWVYLPDGKKYQYDDIGREWKTQAKADEAYHRYLMQLGAMDKLLGNLLDKLDEQQIFDDAIIAVTADHGLIFRTEVTKRGINPKAAPNSIKASAVRVPFLIKYPNQKVGKVDKRFVLNTDILPTILDDLSDSDISNYFDGQSLLSPSYIEKDGIRFVIRNEERNFSKQEILNAVSVINRIEKFGQNTPLGKQKLQGEHSDLYEKTLSEMFDLSQASTFNPVLELQTKLDSTVFLNGNFLPAFFDADLSFLTLNQPLGLKFDIAIALNDEIVSIVPATGEGVIRNVRAILPPDYFVQGYNKISAFLIYKDPKGVRRVLDIQLKSNLYSITDDFIKTSEANFQYAIEPTISGGKMTQATNHQKKSQIFGGWAADLESHICAERVLVFEKTKFLGWSETGLPTRGLAERYKAESLATCRFVAPIELSHIERIEDIRLFGLFENRVARELD